MGDTGDVEGVFGKTVYTVFAIVGEGFVNSFISSFFYSLERKESIVKTLYGFG